MKTVDSVIGPVLLALKSPITADREHCLDKSCRLATLPPLGFHHNASTTIVPHRHESHSQQMFAIKHVDFQSKGIDAFDATQIDAVVAELACGFVKRINAAAFAKIVFGGFGAELVQPQGIVLGVYLE